MRLWPQRFAIALSGLIDCTMQVRMAERMGIATELKNALRGRAQLESSSSIIYAASCSRSCYYTSDESYGCPLSSGVW